MVGAGTLVGMAMPSHASTVLVIAYDHENWGGTAHTFTETSDGFVCPGPTSDVDASYSSFSKGWSNQTSSMKTFSNCAAKWFDGENFTGDQTVWLTTTS